MKQQQQAELGDKKQQVELGDKQRVLRLLQSELVPLVLKLAAQWGFNVPVEESLPSIDELCSARVPPAQLLAKFIEHPAHAHSFPHIAAYVFSTFFVELQDLNADAGKSADRATELIKSHLVAALDDPSTSNITLGVWLQLNHILEYEYFLYYCLFSEAIVLLNF